MDPEYEPTKDADSNKRARPSSSDMQDISAGTSANSAFASVAVPSLADGCSPEVTKEGNGLFENNVSEQTKAGGASGVDAEAGKYILSYSIYSKISNTSFFDNPFYL